MFAVNVRTAFFFIITYYSYYRTFKLIYISNYYFITMTTYLYVRLQTSNENEHYILLHVYT